MPVGRGQRELRASDVEQEEFTTAARRTRRPHEGETANAIFPHNFFPASWCT